MARARNIKPGFYANEELAECSVWARFIFPGLWMLADRAGRLEDRPKRIKGELLRYDNVEIEPLLDELASHGFIVRYAVAERQLIQVTAFGKHQNPHHREADSVLPAPPLDVEPPTTANCAEQLPEPTPIEGSSSATDTETQGNPESDDDEIRQTLDQSKESPGLAQGQAQPRQGLAVLIPDSGFRIPDSKEKRASHASEPAAEPERAVPKPMSAKERVWSLGPEIVGGAETSARTFLGKLVANHGEEIVSEALTACAIERPGGGTKGWLLNACATRSKATHSPAVEMTGEDKPAWAVKAGFPNRFEAGNEGCYEHNAAQYRNGKRLEVSA